MNRTQRAQVVLKVIGCHADPASAAIGCFVQWADYAANDGWGCIHVCDRWIDAQRFANERAAVEWATTPSPVRPEVDGEMFFPTLYLAYSCVRVGALLDEESVILTRKSPTLH